MNRYNMLAFLGRFIDEPNECDLFKLLALIPTPVTPEGPWIAGGAVRRTLAQDELDSDLDFFFRDEAQKTAFVAALEGAGGFCLGTKEHAATYSITLDGKKLLVQAITMAYYANLEAVLDSFDFTITQCGYDGADLVVGEFTLWDLARKRLALHKLTYGVSTVRRLIKYTRQGFAACGGALASILEATISDPTTIHREVTYVD